MNNILFRSSNDIDKNNYKVIFLLILFTIFKIFYTGIYPFINGTSSLIIIFKPLIFYIIYYLIIFMFNNKHDSYYILSSLIISFIVPIDTPIYIFIIGSIIGNIISHLSKDNISSTSTSMMVIYFYLSYSGNFNMLSFTGIFKYVYLLLIVISLIYLIINKLIKTKILLFSLIGIIILGFMFDITLFCLLFIVLDNRYSPVTKYGQVFGSIIFILCIYIFRFIFNIEYYLFLSMFSYQVLSIIINYLSVKLYGNKIFRLLFSN